MIPAKQFIFAGAAVFTLSEGDRHYTYRINRKDPTEQDIKMYKDGRLRFKPETVWFVNLGIGYENHIYAGLMKSTEATEIQYTKASRCQPSNPSMEMLTRFLKAIQETVYVNADGSRDTINGIRFQHEGRCCVCSRPLTNPASIDSGIGPECAGKLGGG